MYQLVRQASLKDFLVAEAPALVLSLVVAEVFYKFHSFLLEAVAFLITWYVIGALVALVLGRHKMGDNGTS